MKILEFRIQSINQLQPLYEKQEAEAIMRRMLLHILNCSPTELLMKQEEPLDTMQLNLLQKFVEKLSKGTPLQYVLGETHFYDLDLYCNQGVLIPRLETEELVDWIIQTEKEPKNILDIGVGSGCITVALGVNLKYSHLTALDISLKALDLARENSDKYNLRPTFLYGDILKWQQLGLETYDVIVSNPPYVLETDKKMMHKNVIDFEPKTALFVPNENPLIFYEAITDLGQQHLAQKGRLYFEIHECMGEKMVEMLKKKNYKDIELRKDINNKDRMIKAVWK